MLAAVQARTCRCWCLESGHLVELLVSTTRRACLQRHIEKVSRCGWNNIQLRRHDAAVLATVNTQADAVISTYCLGIVYDLEAALKRATEILKPGGRIAILDFQRVYPEQGLLRVSFSIYRWLLQYYGIDAPEDLDNKVLRTRWENGEMFLRSTLGDVSIQTFLLDMGL